MHRNFPTLFPLHIHLRLWTTVIVCERAHAATPGEGRPLCPYLLVRAPLAVSACVKHEVVMGLCTAEQQQWKMCSFELPVITMQR